MNGSIELAPLVGLAEVIVDIVETGSTLKENNLAVLENDNFSLTNKGMLLSNTIISEILEEL